MSKSKNKTKEKRLKKHLHLNISAELYEKVKKIGVNVSQFVEEALNALISGTNSQNIQNTLILSLESKKKEPQTGFEPVTSSLPRTYEAPIDERNSDSPPIENEGEKIFTPSGNEGGGVSVASTNRLGRVHTHPAPTYQDLPMKKLDVKEAAVYGVAPIPGQKTVTLDTVLPGYPMVDIPTFYKDERVQNAFHAYCEDVLGLGFGRNDRGRRYHNALLKLAPVYSTDDRLNYDEINEGNNPSQMAHNAMTAFFKFCNSSLGLVTFNGELISEWISPTKGYKYGGIKDSNSAMSGRYYNLSNAAVYAALGKLPLDVRIFYMLLAMSGARASQLYKLLTESKERHIVVNDVSPEKGIRHKVVSLDAREMSTGTKRAYFYMFPGEYEELVRTYKPETPLETIMKSLNSLTQFERVNDEGETEIAACNANSLRKWQAAVLLRFADEHGQRLRTDEVNIIQGRVAEDSESVLVEHYSPKLILGVSAYSKVCPIVLETLPPAALSLPNPSEVPNPSGTPAKKENKPKEKKPKEEEPKPPRKPNAAAELLKKKGINRV